MYKRYNEFINGPWYDMPEDTEDRSYYFGPSIILLTGTYYLDDFFRDEQGITVYMYVWESLRKND